MAIQLQFLNRVLDTKDTSIISSNNITVDFFPDYKEEFRFIDDHIRTYGVCPDKETFLSKFPRFDVIVVNEPDDYLINALFEDRKTRSIVTAYNKVRDLMLKGKLDEAVQACMSVNDSLLQSNSISSVDIISDTSRYQRYVEKIANFETYYVKTGFDELDKIIGGWDRKEELATIVARTNMGKSWILLKTALSAAQQGLNVGLYSGEMSEDKVGYRIDTLMSHISNGALTHGSEAVINEYKKYIDSLPTKISGHIKVFTPEHNGGLASVTTLRAFIEKENLDMLCIDQHSLLIDDKNGRSSIDKASNISRDLKTLQVLKKIPIISVCQQNRESTENGIDTTHISLSDRIGQDSTVIIAFEQKNNVMSMHLIKSRDSSKGNVLKYALDLDRGTFTYIPIEGDGTNGEGSKELYNEYEYSSNEGQPF